MLGAWLQVRRGEATRTVLLFAYLFLVITSYVVTKSARDALFLERYSTAELPYGDIASAVAVAAAMAAYLRLSRRFGIRMLLVGTLLLFAAMSLGFWTLGRSGDRPWLQPVMYVWAGVFGVLLPTQVWTLANYVVTTREAKRLFGVIGSGAISGWIVGGLLTRATAVRLGSESLLLLTSGALAICPLIVLAVWRERHVDESSGAVRREDGRGLADSFDLVRRSPHLRAVAIMIILSSLVTTIVAWQFKAISKAYYPDTDALTAFFGTFNVYAGILSLVTQLFLTSRLLRRFGLGVVLLVVPLALTAGSLGVLMSSSLAAAVMLKGGDHVLRYSIDRSSVELLYLPVPERLMARAKAFIDTVVWRMGDAAGALLVLVAVRFFGVTASEISTVTIMLLMGWMAAAVMAKRQYVETLQSSIYAHRLDAERLSAHVADRSTTDVLINTLNAENPADVLYALTLFGNRDAPMAHQAVRRLLDHQSPAVRKKAIAVLAAADDAAVLPQVERLLTDDDADVRAEALIYLARLSHVDPLTRLDDLHDVDASVIAPAIVHFLARSGPAQNIDAVRMLLNAALAAEGAAGELSRVEVARLIGSLPDRFDQQLNQLLKDPAPEVVGLAMRAAAALGKTAAIPLMVSRLSDDRLSADAADALVACGNDAVPVLRDALGDEQAGADGRRAIPDVLQRVGTPAAEETLADHLLSADPILRLRVIAALNKLRQLNPERRLERELVETVLAAEIFGNYRSYQILGKLWAEDATDQSAVEGVKESMARELERIFRLMKLLFPAQDLHSAYVGLHSTNASVHALAVEFLEHSLPSPMRALLLPLIDDEASAEDRIAIADRLVGAPPETPEDARAAMAASEQLLHDAARHAQRQLEHEPVTIEKP